MSFYAWKLVLIGSWMRKDAIFGRFWDSEKKIEILKFEFFWNSKNAKKTSGNASDFWQHSYL